jgi:hypothetical protein
VGRRVAGLAVGAAVSVCACSPSSTVGVLGRGHFQYECGSAIDSYCGTSTSSTDLPGAIAVGATFAVAYAPLSSDSTNTVEGTTGYQIVPASQEFATASGTTILANRPGIVALLAQHVGNANVDDFAYLTFKAIQSVRATPASVSIAAGETQSVRLDASDAVGGSLAGQLACQWEITRGASAVSLQVLSTGGSATLRALAGGGGDATVRATCGGATADVTVQAIGGVAIDGGSHD